MNTCYAVRPAALARETSFVLRISSFASIDFPACEIRFTFHEERSLGRLARAFMNNPG